MTDENKVEPTVQGGAGVAEDTVSADAAAENIGANNIVKNHIIASMALGLVPVPLFDIAALVTTQMNMLRSLSEHYDLPFDDTDSRSLITSLIGGSLPVLGVLGLSSFAKLIPGVGTLLGSASLGVSAGAVTYAVGQTFIMHFEGGGTIGNFDASKAQAFFKREFDKGKALVRDIRDEVKGPAAAGKAAGETADTQTPP